MNYFRNPLLRVKAENNKQENYLDIVHNEIG